MNSKILLVEDNEFTALALSRMLKKHGYEVAVAPDAISALDCALRFEPDLVLLDISIPGGNGFSVAENIQKILSKPVHIFFITSGIDPQLKAKAEAMGAAEFIQKPFSMAQLLESIRDTMEGRRSTRKEVYALH
jgi:DNA-binding response OmpR family regulator